MISIFDEFDISWAHWNYKNDFPIVSEDLKSINEILDVLITNRQ